jgi:hypothetical protein
VFGGKFQNLPHLVPPPSVRDNDLFQHLRMGKKNLPERVDAIDHLHDIPP